MTGNVIQPNGASGTIETRIIVKNITKSDFVSLGDGTYRAQYVNFTPEEVTAIKNAKFTILTVYKFCPNKEWFGILNICTPIVIPSDVFTANSQSWGAIINQNYKHVNFQYHSSSGGAVIQTVITETEYNDINSSNKYVWRFVLFT